MPWAKVLVAVVVLWLLWTLRSVVLLCFGAIIVAAFLRALADPVQAQLRVSQQVAILLVVALLVLFLGVAAWSAGQPMLQQLSDLQATVPRAWAAARRWLANQPLGQSLFQWTGSLADIEIPWARVALFASAAGGALADLFLVLLLGIYLALDPQIYRRGFVSLFPPARRRSIDSTLLESADALRRWLLGQGMTMLIVGSTVGVGLSLLGMPLAGAIGLISGLLEFIPFFGAIAAALLGTLLAFAQGPTEALYVGLFFFGIQQIEGNFVTPLVQRWAAHLPPVLSLLAVVVFGTLFGLPGIVLGTPLMVVAIVIIKSLYVDAVLERPAAP